MNNTMRIIFVFLVTAASFLFPVSNSFASSFPFRSIAVGDSVPPVSVTDYKTKQSVSFASFKGKPFVILFWGGADQPAKKERSIKAFTSLQDLMPFFEQRKIAVISVNVQEDPAAVIEEIVTQSKSAVPMYIDSGKTLYGDLGIFVMPALLLIDKDGKVVTGMGYSHDIIDRLKGECEILLGEKNREQVEEALRPKVVDKSPEEKSALRFVGMAQVLIKRGQNDGAIREYQEAIKVYPAIGGDAYIELGCLYLDIGNFDEADKMLEKGLKMTPGSLRGQICSARILAQDNVQDGISELESLLLRKSQSPDIHYVLGTFYEKLPNVDKAAKEYRKAYELLERQSSME